MKINKIVNISVILQVIFLFAGLFQSCSTVEKQHVTVEKKILTCCPDGGGLLDSLINNNDDTTNEYAPYIVFGDVNDVLWFSSSREKEFKDKKRTFYPGELMFATRPKTLRNLCSNDGWSKPERFKTNDAIFDKWTRGTVAFYDDKMIIASESSLDGKTPDESHGVSYNLDLWQLTKTNGVYGNPVALTSVNSVYWESQPCLSPDKNVLFFVSNRPLKIEDKLAGNKHIWYSKRNEGSWSEPKPLSTINSPGEEVSPHCGIDGKFYFSSNWNRETDALSSANFDIFVCEKFSKIDGIMLPVEPINMNYLAQKNICGAEMKLEINSPGNEMFPFISPDRKAIYWASDKKGGYGKLDLYSCSLPPQCQKLIVSVVQRVLDTTGGKMLIVDESKQIAKLPLRLTGDANKIIYSDVEEKLEAGRKYKVFYDSQGKECYDCSCNPQMLEIETSINDTTIRDTIYCVCYKRSRLEVALSTGHVPFFITGYWWPSTSENIAEFKRRTNSKILDTSFINPNDFDYFNPVTTQTIDNFFEDRIYKKLDKIAADLSTCGGDDVIAITVRGYTDESRLRPGRYSVDETISVGDIVIPTGWKMLNTWANTIDGKRVDLFEEGQAGNIMLSKLRAYYTYKTIEKEMLKQSPAFKKLYEKKQVIFDYEGYGIYDRNTPCKIEANAIAGAQLSKEPSIKDKSNNPMSRRISVYFELIPKVAANIYKISRCGTPADEYETWMKDNTVNVEKKKKEAIEKQEQDRKQAERDAAGCGGPDCYKIVFGLAVNQQVFEAAKKLLDYFGMEVFGEKQDDGNLLMVSPRMTQEKAEKTLRQYQENFENYFKGLTKKVDLNAEIIKIGS